MRKTIAVIMVVIAALAASTSASSSAGVVLTRAAPSATHARSGDCEVPTRAARATGLRDVFGPPLRNQRIAGRCGGGVIPLVSELPRGAFTGGGVRVPVAAKGTAVGLGFLGVLYGMVQKSYGTLTGPVKRTRMRDFVKSQRVPWPDPYSSTAQRYRKTPYNVYQIWFRHRRTHVLRAWKYGITRVGARRPEAGVRRCERAVDPSGGLLAARDSCKWKWLRVGVQGYWRARVWEATYTARYVARFGRCPTGMPACM